jgi:hypothetical protein
MQILPLRQHQFGLAHQSHQDELEGDLELAADLSRKIALFTRISAT